MIKEPARIVEIAEGIWRISSNLPFGNLEENIYLVSGGGEYCLLDVGPVALAEALIGATSSIVPLASISSLVILDASSMGCSALRFWSLAGFGGKAFADWRASGFLAFGGGGTVSELWNQDSILFPDSALAMKVFRLGPPMGPIALLHEASGLAFSGRIASSIGKGLPEKAADPELRLQREFAVVYGYDRASAEFAEAGASATLCPRFGSLVPPSLSGKAIALAGPMASAAEDQGIDGAALERELRELRKSNYELKLSMVTASDEALRDQASGLYGRIYADSFMKSVMEKGMAFSAAFVRIDRIKELNRKLGPQAADQVIRDLAALLEESVPEAFLFRWTGPIILAVLEGSRGEVFSRLEAIRGAVEAERRFASPITVSIALARTDELGEGSEGFKTLVDIARERLKLLDRRGGNTVLDKSDLKLEDRALVLALDSDPLFLDFLVESLDRQGFRTMGAFKGGDALKFMDSAKPELVIADVALPQFDAFQIRLRMRSSPDLHDIPFVLTTDFKTDEIVARAHSLSIFHVFEKPVSMVELAGIARYLLGRSEDGA